MKILFISAEIFPFAKTGGLSDVSGSLPKSLKKIGCDVRSMMPFYKRVGEGTHEVKLLKSGIRHDTIFMTRGDLYMNETDGFVTYFVGHRAYFMRDELYGTNLGDYPDNVLRFSFFCKAALACLKEIDFKPDIIHCNDWQTALIPFYIKYKCADDKFFSGIKTLYTIHNLAYQGIFSRKYIKLVGIPPFFFSPEKMEFFGNINFMKAGILYADAISTVSRRYAEEITTPEYGMGLDSLLRRRQSSLYGIVNGADYSNWDPVADSHIKSNYDINSKEKKLLCKKDLLDYVKLPPDTDKPVLGCISRLVEQKGMDMVMDIMGRIVRLGARVVVLGTGRLDYEMMFKFLEKEYPENVRYCKEFNDDLAHKIQAGSDIFLMPSRYEPCGLTHMYSLKYGTVPVVRATGGLDDVIIDFDADREKGNGFKFGPPNLELFYETIQRAVRCYDNKGLWEKLMTNAMSCDFSWDKPALEYMELYRNMLYGNNSNKKESE